MKKIISSIMAFLCLILSLAGCGRTVSAASTPVPESERTHITVWYADDGSSLWDNFRAMTSGYNSGDGAIAGVSVTATPYQSDGALISALAEAGQSGAPSVVLCSMPAALSIESSGTAVHTDTYFSKADLGEVSEIYLGPGELDGRLICVPLASAPDVLMVNTALAGKLQGYSDSMLASPEGVCGAAADYSKANGSPFFTADSFTTIFRVCLAQYGEEFHADKSKDIQSEHYVYLYNLVAEGAFNGGVTSSDGDAAKLVASGVLPCAAVTSSEVMKYAALGSDGIKVLPFPVVENGKAVFSASLCESVITASDESEQKAGAVFISWLLGQGKNLAGESGYFPVSQALDSVPSDAGTKYPALYASLCGAVQTMGKSYTLAFETPEADNFQKDAEFETYFRETLAGLS